MNNIYLKKLIEQETLNVKLQLVQEHLQLAKEEFSQKQKDLNTINISSVLSEQVDASGEWPAPANKAQKFFKNLKVKGIPVTERFPGANANYEVTIDIDPSTLKNSKQTKIYKNLFRFYKDGSVYDYNLMKTIGYSYDGNKISLLAKNPDAIISTATADNVLATIDSNGKFNQIVEPVDVDPGAKYKSWLDPLQQILDYAGLIPYVGDALDAINACIYFWRGRYFEGFLSLIAIIPIVGSVLSLGVKTALKAGGKSLTKLGATSLIKRWWLKGDTKAIGELGELLLKNGVSVNQMSAISTGMATSGKKLNVFSRGIKKSFGDGSIVKNVDNAGESLVGAGKSIDKAIATNKAAKATKAVGDQVAKTGFKLFKTPKAILNGLTFNLLPRIKKLPFYPTKKLAKMAAATESRFIKQSMKQPSQLGLLTKFGGKEQRQAVRTQLSKQIDELDPKRQDAIFNVLIDNPKLTKYFPDQTVRGTDFNSLLQSADGTTEFFTQLRKVDKKLAGNLAETLIDQSIKSENLIWSAYKSSTANKVISGAFGRGIQLQFAKNIDIIYDEMQLAGAGMGFENPEQLKEYGIVPFTKWSIQSAMPGSYAYGAKQLEAVGEMGKSAKEAVASGLGAFGIQLDTLNEYPPIGAEEYTYQEDNN